MSQIENEDGNSGHRLFLNDAMCELQGIIQGRKVDEDKLIILNDRAASDRGDVAAVTTLFLILVVAGKLFSDLTMKDERCILEIQEEILMDNKFFDMMLFFRRGTPARDGMLFFRRGLPARDGMLFFRRWLPARDGMLSFRRGLSAVWMRARYGTL